MPAIDLANADHLLSTTRAVRKRLDFDRPVPRELILECIRISQQAPTGSNQQGWRWLVVEDAAKKEKLADIYRQGLTDYLKFQLAQATGDQDHRVFESAMYLLERFHEVPVLVVPCVQRYPGDPGGPLTPMAAAGLLGSLYPAIWSFMLAARARGLGTTLTTAHLIAGEESVRDLLGIPADFLQGGIIPVGYYTGDDFKPAARPAPETITFFDSWGS